LKKTATEVSSPFPGSSLFLGVISPGLFYRWPKEISDFSKTRFSLCACAMADQGKEDKLWDGGDGYLYRRDPFCAAGLPDLGGSWQRHVDAAVDAAAAAQKLSLQAEEVDKAGQDSTALWAEVQRQLVLNTMHTNRAANLKPISSSAH
jgi:hypothetical protein